MTHKVSVAKTVLDETGYHIMPNRIIDPSQYSHPSHTVESKKALLVSLGPMLTKAEGDRKQVLQACEAFTRCKVAKVKGNREMSFSYRDIDNACEVSHEEYEMRYMLYLDSCQSGGASTKKTAKIKSPFHEAAPPAPMCASETKVVRNCPASPAPILESVAMSEPHSPTRPGTAPTQPVFGEAFPAGSSVVQASPAGGAVTASVPIISAIDENNMLAIMNIPGSPCRGALSRSSNATKRRQTLSPQSSKDMLREVCDDMTTAADDSPATTDPDTAPETESADVATPEETQSSSQSAPVILPDLLENTTDIVVLEKEAPVEAAEVVEEAVAQLPATPLDECDFDDSEMLEIDAFSSSRPNARKRKPANDLNSSRRKSLDVEDLQSMFDDMSDTETPDQEQTDETSAEEDVTAAATPSNADLWDECQILSAEVERNISTPLCSPMLPCPSPSKMQSEYNGCGGAVGLGLIMDSNRASPCVFSPASPTSLASPSKLTSGFSPALRGSPAKIMASGDRLAIHRSPAAVEPSFVPSPEVTRTKRAAVTENNSSNSSSVNASPVKDTHVEPTKEVVVESEPATDSVPLSEAEAEAQAYCRYVVRMEICKNKFRWEMASIAAAKAAKKKFGTEL